MRSCLSLMFWLAAVVGVPAVAVESGFGSLHALMASRGVNSVEALIAALPVDLRTHYALVFASRSLQGASFTNPRAILFGSDAQLVVTFNGDSAQRGYASVETMAFNHRDNTFELREILFRERAPPVISEANPARCLGCHGRPAGPIWDAPPTWPGVYGERYLAGLSAIERRGIRSFLALQADHARYRSLVNARAFAERETYVTSAQALYNNARTEPPNAQLSSLLTGQKIRSIMSTLSASPAFSAHRFALLAATQESCGPLADFYPAAVRAAVASGLQSFTRQSAATEQLQAHAKSERLLAPNRGNFREMAAPDLSKVRYVVEFGLEIPTQNWTLALETNSHALAAPEGAYTLEQALIEAVAQNDESLRDLLALRAPGGDDRFCEQLRRQSVRALETWYAAQPTASADRASIRRWRAL